MFGQETYKDVENEFEEGNTCFSVSNPEEALKHYKEALTKFNKIHNPSLEDIVNLRKKARELRDKIAILRKATPKFLEAIDNYHKLSLEYYDAIISKKPCDPSAHCGKGNAYIEAGQYDDALKCINEALKFYPGYEDALVSKGRVLIKLNQNKEAIKLFNQVALRLNPNLYALIGIGNSHMNLGDQCEFGSAAAQDHYAQAREAYQKVKDAKPDSVKYKNVLEDALNGLFNLYFRQSEDKEGLVQALDFCNQILLTNPQHVYALNTQANVYFFQSRIDDALNIFNKIKYELRPPATIIADLERISRNSGGSYRSFEEGIRECSRFKKYESIKHKQLIEEMFTQAQKNQQTLLQSQNMLVQGQNKIQATVARTEAIGTRTEAAAVRIETTVVKIDEKVDVAIAAVSKTHDLVTVKLAQYQENMENIAKGENDRRNGEREQLQPILAREAVAQEVKREQEEIEKVPSAAAFYDKLHIRLEGLLKGDLQLVTGKFQAGPTQTQGVVGGIAAKAPLIGDTLKWGVDKLQDHARDKRYQRIEELFSDRDSCKFFAEYFARMATLHYLRLGHFSANGAGKIPGTDAGYASLLGEAAAKKAHHYLKREPLTVDPDEKTDGITIARIASEKIFTVLGDLQDILGWTDKLKQKFSSDENAPYNSKIRFHHPVPVGKTAASPPPTPAIDRTTITSAEQGGAPKVNNSYKVS